MLHVDYSYCESNNYPCLLEDAPDKNHQRVPSVDVRSCVNAWRSFPACLVALQELVELVCPYWVVVWECYDAFFSLTFSDILEPMTSHVMYNTCTIVYKPAFIP